MSGHNAPGDGADPCDDGSQVFLPAIITEEHCVNAEQLELVMEMVHEGPFTPPPLFWAFVAYVLAWLGDAARDIRAGALPSLPYFSRPMPVLASITGGADFSLAAAMDGREHGGPQVFGGARHRHGHKCLALAYLPETVVVITPGFVEVTLRSGASRLVESGWVAKRREDMARAASLSFGRPRTRAVKA